MEREGGDACLVGVGADVSVRDAPCDPDDALVDIASVFADMPLAYDFHHPDFVFVCDGKGFAGGVVAVFVGEVRNELNGFTCGPAALQCNIDERAVVDSPVRVNKLAAPSEGGLGDYELVLVHVAHPLVGMRNLRNLAEVSSAVPIVYLAHASAFPVGSRSEVKFAEQLVGVCGI